MRSGSDPLLCGYRSAVNTERARTGVNEEEFVVAFRAACDALAGAGVPYLFMGGIASIVHGRTSWTHDLDVFIR